MIYLVLLDILGIYSGLMRALTEKTAHAHLLGRVMLRLGLESYPWT